MNQIPQLSPRRLSASLLFFVLISVGCSGDVVTGVGRQGMLQDCVRFERALDYDERSYVPSYGDATACRGPEQQRYYACRVGTGGMTSDGGLWSSTFPAAIDFLAPDGAQLRWPRTPQPMSNDEDLQYACTATDESVYSEFRDCHGEPCFEQGSPANAVSDLLESCFGAGDCSHRIFFDDPPKWNMTIEIYERSSVSVVATVTTGRPTPDGGLMPLPAGALRTSGPESMVLDVRPGDEVSVQIRASGVEDLLLPSRPYREVDDNYQIDNDRIRFKIGEDSPRALTWMVQPTPETERRFSVSVDLDTSSF